MSKNDNDEKPSRDPTVILDEHRGLKARFETDVRRRQSAVRADQNALRQGHAELEKQLFAGPATGWPQAAEKARYLLRRFAATGEAQDPRYQKLIRDTLEDLERLVDHAPESAP